MSDFSEKVQKINQKRKNLQSKLSAANAELETTVNNYIIDIIKKHGTEKDGWIELNLGKDGLPVKISVEEYNAAGNYGISMQYKKRVSFIKKLKIATEKRYINDFNPTGALFSMACGHNLNHESTPDTIIMDSYLKVYYGEKYDTHSTNYSLYFSQSYPIEDRIQFIKELENFISKV